MRIVVNTRLLQKNKLEGIGNFVFETFKRLTENQPEHEFFFLFDRPYSKELEFSKNVTPIVCGPPARHPLLYVVWFEITVPYILKKYKADLFISPDGYVSLFTKTRTLQVVHDISFEHHPEFTPYVARKYNQFFFPKFVRRADRIATVSEFSKQDIMNLYKCENKKIDIVYSGVKEYLAPVSSEIKFQFKKQYADGNEYFFFIGSLHPRKNMVNLFKAFDEFKKHTGSKMKLIISGSIYWWSKQMEKEYKKIEYRKDIIFTGRVDEVTLNNLLGSSFALTYVSFFEGFGLPIFEAMYCEVPIITSNTSSMPEVGGNAALYANPYDYKSIANEMIKLTSNPNLREELISNGKIQKLKFSWNNTSDLLWESICKTLNI